MMGRIGLLVCLLGFLQVRPALAEFVCTADYLSGFDERLLDGDCEEVYSAPINGPSGVSILRLVRYVGPSHGADDWIPMVDELAARVGAALREMGGVRLQGTVSVFLVPDTLIDTIPGTSTTGPVHGSLNAISGDECFLAMYKLPSETSVEEFVFTMAHEIFHCAQYETWREAADLEAADWWVEGSAEYFANLAMPGTGSSDGWAAAFDQGVLDASMLTLSYHTVVFFSWLHQTAGAGAVSGLLAAMPASEGTEAQMSALAGQISADDWQGFVEAYLGGQVRFPGGGTVPSPSAIRGFYDFPAGDGADYAVEPFQIDRIDLVFARDNTFDVTNAENGLRTGASEGDQDFAPMPETVNACESEKTFRFYATTTTRAGPGRLQVPRPELGSGACCLVGAWSPTQETLDGFGATAMQIGAGSIAAAGANLSCGYSSGGWILTFGASGTGNLDYQANTTTCTVSGAGGNMRFEESRSGVIGFDWRVVEEGAGMATYTDNTLAWNIAIHIGPVVQNQGGPDAGPSTRSNGFAFTCERDTLTIQGLYGLSNAEATYLRFSE